MDFRVHSVYQALKIPILILSASALLGGCSTEGFVSETPVHNDAPPLKAGVYPIKAVDVRPVATKQVEPPFPPELGSILTGKALVVFTVRTDGKVEDASVLAADDVLFGEAAVSAVLKWRFRPAQIQGAPVNCQMTMPFIFDSPYGYYTIGGAMPDGSGGPPPDHPGKTAIEAH